MARKRFVDMTEVRNNGIKVAKKIAADGFNPSVIYVSLRGGALLGNIVSEVFRLLQDEHPPLYAAVIARSYTDLNKRSQIHLDGWTYNPEHLRQADKVLLVDDIYDTGNTVNFLADAIMNRGISRANLRILVHDYKEFSNKEQPAIKPDYFINHYKINREEDDFWIHFCSHELQGLSSEELEEFYYQNHPDLKSSMKDLPF